MSLETAARVGEWLERELDRVRPERFVLTFFGGEPLLNLPVMYSSPSGVGRAAKARGVRLRSNIITNGLLLTPEVVDRMLPFGLNGMKITLDGDRDTHNRMRPLRGGQGTFDRIVENIRPVAGRCRIAIGGNFDESSVEQLSRRCSTSCRRRISATSSSRSTSSRSSATDAARCAKGIIPLTPVGAASKPLEGHVHDVGRLRRGTSLRHLRLRSTTRCRSSARRRSARLPDARRRATTGRATCT